MEYIVNGLLMDAMTPDDFGTVWSVAMNGWHGTPETRGPTENRPNDDGEFEGSQYYQSRSITMSIWGLSPDEAECRAAKARLGRLLEINKRLEVQSAESPPLSVSGVRTGRLLATLDVNKLTASAVLRCRDPRKYGPGERVSTTLPKPSALVPPLIPPLVVGGSGGSVVVYNSGDYPTPGLLTFQGPIPGPFYAQNTRDGRREAYNMNLADGDNLVVNMRTGTATLNGTTNRKGLRTFDSQRWTFKPGETTVLFGAAAYDAGKLFIDYAPAYMS